jgi:hypothetical protein
LTLVRENDPFAASITVLSTLVRANDRPELHACQFDRRTFVRESVATAFTG